jgi:YfiH family protein
MRSHLLLQIPGIEHGFFTRQQLVPVLPSQTDWATEWSSLKPRWNQVHGTSSCEVIHAAQECGAVDALWTGMPGLPIGAVSADCVPILLSRRDGRKVAAVHAGWRGTQARILERLWDTLRAAGEQPRDWIAAVGPAIGPCCYEVSEELARDFRREFGWEAVPSFRHLDLPLVNAQQLRRIGLEDLELLRSCTRCARAEDGSFLFNSYRRDGKSSPQYSIIRVSGSTAR